jgi:hypothetical protein
METLGAVEFNHDEWRCRCGEPNNFFKWQCKKCHRSKPR